MIHKNDAKYFSKLAPFLIWPPEFLFGPQNWPNGKGWQKKALVSLICVLFDYIVLTKPNYPLVFSNCGVPASTNGCAIVHIWVIAWLSRLVLLMFFFQFANRIPLSVRRWSHHWTPLDDKEVDDPLPIWIHRSRCRLTHHSNNKNKCF